MGHTSGAAELSAQAWALMLALEQCHSSEIQRVCIRYDSRVAAMTAEAICRATVHPILIAISATLKNVLEKHVRLEFEHVYAHQAEPWSELADSIAKAAIHAPSIRKNGLPPCSHWAHLPIGAIRLVNLVYIPPRLGHAHPTVHNGHVLVADAPLLLGIGWPSQPK